MSGRLSEEDLRWLAESCRRSNVPVKITDPGVIVRAARELRGKGHTFRNEERKEVRTRVQNHGDQGT